VKIGGSLDVTPEFGAMMVAQKRGSDDLFEIDAFKCKASGMPMPFTEKAFAESEIPVKPSYDSVEDAVAKIRAVTALAEC